MFVKKVAERCLHALDVGYMCSDQELMTSQAWHYDVTTDRCLAFSYMGCGGNENRFHSEAECDENCAQHSTVTISLGVINIYSNF